MPLATIFQSASIEQIAEILRQADAPFATSLVALQSEGDRLPLFLFQGVDLYRSLAAHLPNQPVYGLAFEMQAFKFDRLEALAAHYLQELQTVQPQGPYLLGGASFGGVVALEVAQQLQATGEIVALLALFDTPALGAFWPKPWLQRMFGHACNLSKFGRSYLSKKLEGKLLPASRWLPVRPKAAKPSPSPARSIADQTRQYQTVRQTYEQIAAAYQPQTYTGRITLFLATDRRAIADSVADSALRLR